MVERVARAIREGRKCGTTQEPLTVPCPFCNWGPHEQDGSETGCIWLARAAIEAMRQPTESMIDAGYEAHFEANVETVYRSMLNAALK